MTAVIRIIIWLTILHTYVSSIILYIYSLQVAVRIKTRIITVINTIEKVYFQFKNRVFLAKRFNFVKTFSIRSLNSA
jgi:hypothetical protein